jgi:hypothetical protein
MTVARQLRSASLHAYRAADLLIDGLSASLRMWS